jgi:nicotinate-nucleotide adenylyltransferase
MNIALFGGTFDPIHRGHLAVAREAMRRYRLDQVHFVPAAAPPHKRSAPRTPYLHRYAMVVLATTGEPRFVPSLLEAPAHLRGDAETRRTGEARPSYSVETVRRFRKSLRAGDRLCFLIGMDAFADIATWHRAGDLLAECDFIVASRPGFSVEDAAAALPRALRPWGLEHTAQGERIVLRATSIYLMSGVRHPASATAVRRAAAHSMPLVAQVGGAVAEYIRKTGLYRRPEAWRR